MNLTKLLLITLLFSCSSLKPTQIKKLYSQNPKKYGELIFQSRLIDLINSDSFGMMSSVNCDHFLFTKLISSLEKRKFQKLYVFCYSGVLGNRKYNLNFTKKMADYIGDCFSSRLNKKFKIVTKGFGETKPFYVLRDTLIDSIIFMKGQIITENKLKLIDKRKAILFQTEMNRVEIYVK